MCLHCTASFFEKDFQEDKILNSSPEKKTPGFNAVYVIMYLWMSNVIQI